MADKPHLLVSNDDGLETSLLRALIEGLSPHFRVSVVAPEAQQSWVGRGFSRHREVCVQARGGFPGRAWAVEGTPSDCVNIALGHLLREDPPVAVASGINIGYNCSLPTLHSSGTIAAALEGAHAGLPAAAFSLEVPREHFKAVTEGASLPDALEASLREVARRAASSMVELIEQPQSGLIVHNWNYPAVTTPQTPVRRTQPAVLRLGSLYRQTAEGVYRFSYPQELSEAPFDSDWEVLRRGEISHSVLDFAALG